MPRLPSYKLNSAAIGTILDWRTWSQGDFAAAVGLSRAHVNRMLRGRRLLGLSARRKLLAWARREGVEPETLWTRP